MIGLWTVYKHQAREIISEPVNYCGVLCVFTRNQYGIFITVRILDIEKVYDSLEKAIESDKVPV